MLVKLREKKALCAGIAAAVFVLAALAWLLLSNRSLQVSAGQNIVVTVSANSLDDVCSYQFKINYDKEKLEYKGNSLKSEIPTITTFSTSIEGYELIGAINDDPKKGVSGRNIAVCEMAFPARQIGAVITRSMMGPSTIKPSTFKKSLHK